MTGGAKHPVGPAVAVPDAVPSVGEVLDPVSGQGQLGGVVAVTWVGVPVKITEGALQHAQETVHVAHNELGRVHRGVPEDPRDHVVGCPHARLFIDV